MMYVRYDLYVHWPRLKDQLHKLILFGQVLAAESVKPWDWNEVVKRFTYVEGGQVEVNETCLFWSVYVIIWTRPMHPPHLTHRHTWSGVHGFSNWDNCLTMAVIPMRFWSIFQVVPLAQAETRLILLELVKRSCQAPPGFEAEAHSFGAVSWVAGSGLEGRDDRRFGDFSGSGDWWSMMAIQPALLDAGCILLFLHQHRWE